MSDFTLIVRQMKQQHGIRVHRWRRAMTGCAWRVNFSDGRSINWIEAPRPKTPISLAIFLHEVGHHVIGFDRYRQRCEEEYHVWLWALGKMEDVGVPPNSAMLRRFEHSMRYAVAKAERHGVESLPESLQRFAG
jgi:hypothetical protein